MTESDSDGWPDKYSDPRDRPHPKILRITVESIDDMREDTIDAAATGETQPAIVSCATVGGLWKILTDRRIKVLQTLMDTEGATESNSAFAEALDRDYKTVHDDVTLLAEYGIVFIVEDDDRSRRPYLPYERIRFNVELTASDSGEEPTVT